MSLRRSFLKSVGSLAVIGAAGSGQAKSKRRKSHEKSDKEDKWSVIYEQSLLESDLHRKISEGFREDGSEKVKEILDESDIAYDQTTTEIGENPNSEEDSGFSTQDMYSGEDAEMNVLSLSQCTSREHDLCVCTNLFKGH